MVGRDVAVDGVLEAEEVVTVWTDSLHTHLWLVVSAGAEQRTDAVYDHSAHLINIL